MTFSTQNKGPHRLRLTCDRQGFASAETFSEHDLAIAEQENLSNGENLKSKRHQEHRTHVEEKSRVAHRDAGAGTVTHNLHERGQKNLHVAASK